MNKPHIYTKEQEQFFRDHIKGCSYKDMHQKFNNHFNLSLSYVQITGKIKRLGLKNGINAQFRKGQISWNTGMKGLQIGGIETQFKKGGIPLNHREVGSERTSKDGYIEVKIAEPAEWMHKHRYVWESHNGPIPKNHAILFLDQNRLNCSIENLTLISRSQLALLNKYNLVSDNPTTTATGIQLVNVLLAIGKRQKELKNKQKGDKRREVV